MSELHLKNRRCRNKKPHEPHVWQGLNTRHDGYQCRGVVGAPAQIIDLMAALKAALANRETPSGATPPTTRGADS